MLKTLNGWLIWRALLVALIILMVLELLGLLINRLDEGQMDDFKETLSHDCLWFQWFCRPVLWSSTRSSSSMERSCRLITSSTGATGSAGGPPSSCWVEESSSACGRTYTRMQCTKLCQPSLLCWKSLRGEYTPYVSISLAVLFSPLFLDRLWRPNLGQGCRSRLPSPLHHTAPALPVSGARWQS